MSLGVDTMHGVGFGEKRRKPANQNIIYYHRRFNSLSISLEDYCADWAVNPPDAQVKWMIIKRVATMVRKMHAGGINHRDCYICHFLLHLPFTGREEDLKNLRNRPASRADTPACSPSLA